MYEYLDRRYALALYEVAEKNGKVDEYLGDLREICELIDKDEEFQEVIKHPQISTKQKKRIFINIFKGKIDEELLYDDEVDVVCPNCKAIILSSDDDDYSCTDCDCEE